jgi:hypothetical protein
VESDLQWKRAVTGHLSSIVNREAVITRMMAQLEPVLKALFPLDIVESEFDTPAHILRELLRELIDLFARLKGERDMYVPYFPTRGRMKDDYMMVVRGNPTVPVFLCLFPGVVKRFWTAQNRSWNQGLLFRASVAMENCLAMD